MKETARRTFDLLFYLNTRLGDGEARELFPGGVNVGFISFLPHTGCGVVVVRRKDGLRERQSETDLAQFWLAAALVSLSSENHHLPPSPN